MQRMFICFPCQVGGNMIEKGDRKGRENGGPGDAARQIAYPSIIFDKCCGNEITVVPRPV